MRCRLAYGAADSTATHCLLLQYCKIQIGFTFLVLAHQSSALSLLLFVIVMKVVPREFRVVLPWELLYADDLAVIAETEEELIKRLNKWKDNVQNRGRMGKKTGLC